MVETKGIPWKDVANPSYKITGNLWCKRVTEHQFHFVVWCTLFKYMYMHRKPLSLKKWSSSRNRSWIFWEARSILSPPLPSHPPPPITPRRKSRRVETLLLDLSVRVLSEELRGQRGHSDVSSSRCNTLSRLIYNNVPAICAFLDGGCLLAYTVYCLW